MQFLISRFKVIKWFLISTSPLLALILGLIISTHFHKPSPALAQEAPDPDPRCVADGLIDYMNKVVDETKNLEKIKLLSPAFNLTNPTEVAIFDNMVSGVGGVSGNFNDLDGFAGNTYNGVDQSIGNPIQAYDWYATHAWSDGRTWLQRFFPNSSNPTDKEMVFTEFGDIDLGRATLDSRPFYISMIGIEFDRAAEDPSGFVSGVNLFSAIHEGGFGNPQFAIRHQLQSNEFEEITQNHPNKAGVNSAQRVTNGDFVNYAKDSYSGNVNWVVEIAYEPGDLNNTVGFAQAALQRGMKPVLRICDNFTCGFTDPATYVQFIKDLNQALASTPGQIYVLTGPNEPATELWASPGCGNVTPYEISQIACGATATPEFHSLRPYPASATCKIASSQAGLCGNDLVLQESIVVTPGESNLGCEPLNPSDPNGGQKCRYSINRNVNVAVDLSRATFPIAGNTENVRNSTNSQVAQSNFFSYGKRMAEYVSWYLNGAIQRAEEPFAFAGDPTGLSNLINYSGPLRKLLPTSIQNGHNYKEYLFFGIIETSYKVIPGLRLLQAMAAGESRHNQVVSCGSQDAPSTCYSESQDYKYMTEIAGSQENWWGGYGPDITGLNPTGDNGTTFPGVQLEPKNAFSYIPFTSTEDLVGNASLSVPSTNLTVGDVQISNLTLSITDPESGKLFFPHMQESLELAEITQNTFIPKDSRSSRDETLTRDIAPAQMSSGEFCEFADSRSNPGDKLYGDVDRVGNENDEPQITGNTSYTATFECEFRPEVDQNLYNQCYSQGYCTSVTACPGLSIPAEGTCSDPNDIICIPPPPEPGNFDNPFCREQALTYSTCEKTVKIPLNMNVDTPEANPVWARLVAGPMSVFRRFFPRTGIGTPVEEIQDIPGETQVAYGAAGIGSSVTATAGSGKSPDSASLYFPHLGGIQEYFLTGIQKALLPYGGSLPSGPPGGETPDPGGGIANCNPDVPDSSVPSQYLARKSTFIDLADRWVTTDNDSHNAQRCFNDVVVRSLAAGINPFFALTIWLNESNASNYLASSTAWEDFGIHTAGTPEDFNSQINLFLQTTQNGAYQSLYPQCFGGNYSDMQTFMYIFHMGPSQCLSNDLNYYNAIFTTTGTTTAGDGPWFWVSGERCIPSYPSDMSCP